MTEILRIKCGLSNSYLLRDGDNMILADTGGKSAGKKIVKFMKKRGLQPENIRLIVLTHGHPDHTGSVEYFRKNYGTKIAVHPSDARITDKLRGVGIIGRLIALFSKNIRQPYIDHEIDLYESMRLDEYGIRATIILLPGHTKGSAGIFFDDRKLIAGDTLMNFFLPSIGKMALDFVLLNKSAIRLKMLNIDTVYPGHGKPFKFSKLF